MPEFVSDPAREQVPSLQCHPYAVARLLNEAILTQARTDLTATECCEHSDLHNHARGQSTIA
jgi:hypothetical protein